jgi:uncharacterized metal-binding protein YceD (DUF177 family)
MTSPEFSRVVRTRPAPPERLTVEADEAERADLAARFAVIALHSLRAELAFDVDGDAIEARGTMIADVTQRCAVSDEDFDVRIEEPLAFRFVTQARPVDPDEEAELPGDEPDEIEFAGDTFDLGEAVAQSLGLAIDPYAEGPNADTARRKAGIVAEGEVEGPLAELLRGFKPN